VSASFDPGPMKSPIISSATPASLRSTIIRANSTARPSILSRSIALRLVPVALAVAGVFLAAPGRGAVTVVDKSGVLTDTVGATSDTSTLSTGTSGSIIDASGVATPFTGVTGIAVDFQAGSQSVTFDSTKFAFTPKVTVNAVAATANSDSIVIEGDHSVTLTGSGSYGGGTTLDTGSTLIVGSGTALGQSELTLSNGSELRGGSGSIMLNSNPVIFANGTTNAIISATTGGTLFVDPLDTTNAR